jgi:phage terminase Nu1 subunit (DNA packaging protein)
MTSLQDRSVAEPERYVDRRELARIMGVHVNTVDRLVKAGMPSETWGVRARRFRPSIAIAWARARDRSTA